MEDDLLLAVGTMSGTSLDGVDAAIIRTDGAARVLPVYDITLPYGTEIREALRACLGMEPTGPQATAAAHAMTDVHIRAVRLLLSAAGIAPHEVAAIGFHGHTVLHAPERRRTWQIGEPERLAAATGIDVVADLRQADVAAGGEGAPLAPVFHAALATNLERPLAVLNVGGVANVTWIGADGTLLAFDTGPGNALIDDLVRVRTGAEMDRDGRLAASGQVDAGRLERLLDHPYFARQPPKSLDRDAFDASPVAELPDADAAATLTRFTAAAVARAQSWFPAPVSRWVVTGGGRRNSALMAALRECLGKPLSAVESVGWNGDAIEAQAFAYLAVRSLRGFPLTFPTTTGVVRPTPGGRLCRAPSSPGRAAGAA